MATQIDREPPLGSAPSGDPGPTGDARSFGQRLRQGGSSAFLINVLGTACGFLVQLLLARTLGVEQFGVYAYAFAWITVLAWLGTLGSRNAFLRFGGAYQACEQWDMLRGFIRYAEFRVTVGSVLIALVGALVVLTLGDRLAPDLRMAFLIGLAIVPLWSFVQVRSALLRSFGAVVAALVPDALGRHLSMIVLFGAMALIYGSSLGAPAAMMAMLTSIAISLIFLCLAVRWKRPAKLRTATLDEERDVWQAALKPLAFMICIKMLVLHTDILMLGLLTDTRTAGLYTAAARLAQLVSFPLLAINVIFGPAAAALHARGDRQGLQAATTLTAWWIGASAIAVALPMALFAPQLLFLFGPDFVEGALALRILALGHVLAAIAGPAAFLLTMTGQESRAAITTGYAAVASVTLNFILIPRFGGVGAAIATTLTMVGLNAGFAVHVRRQLGIAPPILLSIVRLARTGISRR